jgi:hypothetical protein
MTVLKRHLQLLYPCAALYSIHYILFATTTRYGNILCLQINNISLHTHINLTLTMARTPPAIGQRTGQPQMNSNRIRRHLFDTVLIEC